jgi:hypothetical protein
MADDPGIKSPYDPGAAGFDTQAVDLNRSGQLSWHQRRRLLINPALTVPVLLVVLIAWASARPGVVVVIALAIWGWWHWVSTIIDGAIGRCATAEGTVTFGDERIDYLRGVPVTVYELNVAGKRLYVPEQAHAAIPSGAYRVYYTPVSRRVLNVEPVDADSPQPVPAPVAIPARVPGASTPQIPVTGLGSLTRSTASNRATAFGVIASVAALVGMAVSGGGLSCAELPPIAYAGAMVALALSAAGLAVAAKARLEPLAYLWPVIGLAAGASVIVWTVLVVGPMGPNPCISG